MFLLLDEMYCFLMIVRVVVLVLSHLQSHCIVDRGALIYGIGLENKYDEVIMSRGDRRRVPILIGRK